MRLLNNHPYLLFVLLLTILYSALFTQDTALKVVITEWKPYTFIEDSLAKGFEVEIARAVFKDMNIEASFEIMPWKRCLHSLEVGEVDALISMLYTEEREEYTYYPGEHISVSKTAFFTLQDRNIDFGGKYENLKDYSIGVFTGFSYGDEFDNADYLTKDEAADTQALIIKLINGRNDLAAENVAVVSWNAKMLGVKDQLQYIDPPIHHQKLYVGFSRAKGHEQLCKDFSEKLAEFKKTQQYKDILAKYGIYYKEME